MNKLNITKKNVKFTILDNNEELNNESCFVEILVQKDFLNGLLSNITTNNNPTYEEKILLTNREKQVLKYLSKGYNNIQIAKILNVSIHTAKLHVHNILNKLSVQDRTEAVVKAIRYHLIEIQNC